MGLHGLYRFPIMSSETYGSRDTPMPKILSILLILSKNAMELRP